MEKIELNGQEYVEQEEGHPQIKGTLHLPTRRDLPKLMVECGFEPLDPSKYGRVYRNEEQTLLIGFRDTSSRPLSDRTNSIEYQFFIRGPSMRKAKKGYLDLRRAHRITHPQEPLYLYPRKKIQSEPSSLVSLVEKPLKPSHSF